MPMYRPHVNHPAPILTKRLLTVQALPRLEFEVYSGDVPGHVAGGEPLAAMFTEVSPAIVGRTPS